jgi:DNA-directed RNA polymerase alpha subunit
VAAYVEKESGILRAGSCLVDAAWFALRQAARARRGRQHEEPGRPEEAIEVFDRSGAPIEELGISVRAYNVLRAAHLTTVGQLMTTTEDELLSLRNCGRRSLAEYKDQLVAKGFVQPGP